MGWASVRSDNTERGKDRARMHVPTEFQSLGFGGKMTGECVLSLPQSQFTGEKTQLSV